MELDLQPPGTGARRPRGEERYAFEIIWGSDCGGDRGRNGLFGPAALSLIHICAAKAPAP